MRSTYIATVLFETLAEHVALWAGTPDNLELIRSLLRALPLPGHRLNTLAIHLARLKPCPFSGRVTSNEVKMCLGEQGNIWPNHIRGDVLLAHYEGH